MCGVCGAFGPNPATMVMLGTTYQQHRGHEAASVVSTDGVNFYGFGGLGKPSTVFEKGLTPEMDRGTFAAIGQNRYSTTGRSNNPFNVQPIKAEGPNGVIYGGHNGNFPGALMEERQKLFVRGARFKSTMDSEVLVQMVVWAEGSTWVERVANVMKQVSGKGSYTLVILTTDQLIMARDPEGNRPASYAKFDWGWMVASEDTPLRQLRAQEVWSLGPGEIAVIDAAGLRKHSGVESEQRNWCSFESTYLLLPTSTPDGISTSEVRYRQGQRLAELYPVPDADVVIGVPDSGVTAGLGFAQAAGIPYQQWILRDREGGIRTFIEPDAEIRRKLAEKKYIIDPNVAGKRLVVIEDSIVRGLTLEILIEGLFYFGALSVDVRSCFPTIGFDCLFGIDISTEKKLVAEGRTKEETEVVLEQRFQARTVRYLPVEANASTQKRPREDLCYGCSIGQYGTSIETHRDKTILEVA